MANKTGSSETRSFDQTPAKVDPALIQEANPQEDWGQPADEGAAYSANHATRGRKADELRGPGRKTRAATKDQISRR
jgi:hypothetical protein